VPLLNVRLADDDARLAAELRGAGVAISRVVREAIRAEHTRRLGPRRRGRRPSEIVRGICAMFPDEGEPSLGVDTRDRHAVRRHITGRLRSTRS
jgi:hypothetical protein